ncbi:hypothetical protein V1517DRAFT_365102 [Lipomyces orientalis]|uniref:Uncharacterized protein n=1 Tax=Lipomyces orientalis TaxID=1233043 RepID=A0ACC3TXU5_9ASCO
MLAMDGVVSPVGQAISDSAPLDTRQSNRTRVVHLQAAHIMPFMVFRYTKLQRLLSMFAGGTNLQSKLYWLRELDVKLAANGFIGHRPDGDEIIFGMGPQGNDIALPDGELLNIHLDLAIVISKILMDEEDYNEGNMKDTSSAARISALALSLELKRLQDEHSGNDRLQERGSDIWRVTTNSQIGS